MGTGAAAAGTSPVAPEPPLSRSQPACFHCGLPVPAGSRYTLTVLDSPRAFCCPGCREVCHTIAEAGLSDYYRHRTQPAGRADPAVVPDLLRQLALYDRPEVQQSFVQPEGETRWASLILEDIRCAACLWLNERHLRQLDGVLAVELDYASQRARVQWDPARIRLSAILGAITHIGYVAHPYDPSHRDRLLADRKRRDLQRILFAGLVGMPVMEFTLATYFLGEFATGRLELWEIIGRWTTLAAALGVLAYSGQDFFVGAWRDLRLRRPGMDVPIVLGLTTAWIGSLVVAWGGRGDFYVDAVTMFVFLVLLARAYEMRGRVLAADAMDRLARVVPPTARRVAADGAEEEVLALDLSPGDRVWVRPGEVIPADGVLRQGRTAVDQSMLTGEPLPVPKGEGDALVAGTCNREQPVLLEVTRVGPRSTAGQVRHLLERARSSRPRSALLAERVAEWFVPLVLLVAAGTAGIWLWIAPDRALSSVIAVLIVTCPCALALATPMAVAVASGRYAAAGILPLRLEALESLAAADLVVFDKTGTLTRGTLEVVDVELPGRPDPPPPQSPGPPPRGLDRARAVALARALEAHSEHPVGRALRGLGSGPVAAAEALRVVPGYGVEGLVDGRRWRIGRLEFALPEATAGTSGLVGAVGLAESCGTAGTTGVAACAPRSAGAAGKSAGSLPTPSPGSGSPAREGGGVESGPGEGVPLSARGGPTPPEPAAFPRSPANLREHLDGLRRSGLGVVVLADDDGARALFVLRDRSRPGAAEVVAGLAAHGVGEAVILSGDAAPRVAAVAAELGISSYRADQSPGDKLAWIQARQAEGRRVLMVGDGINDAPTLAAADVSVSFGEATDLAQISSDFILLGEDLGALVAARRLAIATRRVIRQNLAWALAYNLLAIPTAALGMVPPWAAALGMSASSLLVVANALRLRRL